MISKTIVLPVLCVAVLLGGCGGGGGGSGEGRASGGSNSGPVGSSPIDTTPTVPSSGDESPDDSTPGDATPGDASGEPGAGDDTGTGGVGNSGGTGGTGNSGGSGDDTGSGSGSGNTGGGDDSTSQQPGATAEGVYAGTLTGSSYHHFKTLVLENDEYWTLYGEETNSFFSVFGFVQGSGQSHEGSYTVSDLRDYALSSTDSGSAVASYDAAARTFEGSYVVDGGAAIQFTGGPITDVAYDYDQTASMSTMIGQWLATNTKGEYVTFDVAADGTVSMSQNGCVASGTLQPRASGKNIFDVTVTFGAAPCELPNETATGVALTYPITDSNQIQLMTAMVTQSRTHGFALFANR